MTKSIQYVDACARGGRVLLIRESKKAHPPTTESPFFLTFLTPNYSKTKSDILRIMFKTYRCKYSFLGRIPVIEEPMAKFPRIQLTDWKDVRTFSACLIKDICIDQVVMCAQQQLHEVTARQRFLRRIVIGRVARYSFGILSQDWEQRKNDAGRSFFFLCFTVCFDSRVYKERRHVADTL